MDPHKIRKRQRRRRMYVWTLKGEEMLGREYHCVQYSGAGFLCAVKSRNKQRSRVG